MRWLAAGGLAEGAARVIFVGGKVLNFVHQQKTKKKKHKKP